MKPKTLLLIDGHYFLFRSFAVPFSFVSKKGTPLHVVTMFLKLIRRSISALPQQKDISVVVVFDTEHRTSNHTTFADYKSNRKLDYSEDADSPFRHLPQIKKVLKFLNIQTLEQRGQEADDIIASLATQFINRNPKGNVFISSRDSDFYQLLSKNLNIIHMNPKDENLVITPAWLKKTLGVTPNQYIRYKSLIGDPTDAIPGIPGVGKVRALGIIKKTLRFDQRPFQKVLERNTALITLSTKLKLPIRWKDTILKSKLLALQNQEFFTKCKF